MVHNVKIKDTGMVQTSITSLSCYEPIEKKNELRNNKACIYHFVVCTMHVISSYRFENGGQKKQK